MGGVSGFAHFQGFGVQRFWGFQGLVFRSTGLRLLRKGFASFVESRHFWVLAHKDIQGLV